MCHWLWFLSPTRENYYFSLPSCRMTIHYLQTLYFQNSSEVFLSYFRNVKNKRKIAGDSGKRSVPSPQGIEGSIHSNNRNRVSADTVSNRGWGRLDGRVSIPASPWGWTAPLREGQALISERLSSAPSNLGPKRVWIPQQLASQRPSTGEDHATQASLQLLVCKMPYPNTTFYWSRFDESGYVAGNFFPQCS